jgi:DNA repair protein RecN (Recombination protein N)
MLAVKVLTFHARLAEAERDGQAERVRGAGAPGLIFDEVDAGIGGRVADVVGRKLRALGSAFQVLCITHLPQIAAYADTHVQIDKRIERGRTSTMVRRLNEDGRVDELSRMLGGEAISEGLRRSAREMLDERAGKARGGRPAAAGKAKGESERAKAKGRRGA